MTERRSSKQGIALIVVVGFLSVLLILAVAFAISMRTERLATRGYVDYMKARHLTWVALARAMDQIEATTVLYPAADVVGSGAGGDCTNILEGTGEGYVPQSLLAAAQAVAAPPGGLAWQPIVDNGKTLGQYAYLVVNCSGLLDASTIGGLARTYGTNVQEIQVGPGVLAEMDPVTYTNLWSARNQYWIRYESVPELNRLGSLPTDSPLRFLVNYPASFFHYSYFLTTQYIDAAGSVTNALYVGGSEAALTAIQPRIQDEFSRIAGIPDASAMTLALLDYVDSNNIPRNTAGICTEPIPMINEVVVTNRISSDVVGADTIYTNSYQILVELWYPFAGYTNDRTYQIQLGAMYSGATPANYNPPSASATVSIPGPWTNGCYYATGSVWRASDPGTNVAPNLANAQVMLNVRLSELGGAGGIVDQFTGPMTFLLAAGGGQPSFGLGKGVNDPRLNWNPADPNQWVDEAQAQITLGGRNASCNPSAAGCDGLAATNMYVRNGPLLTVGELGFLLYDATRPWQTIRLLDDPANGVFAMPVLDRFTLATNHFVQGLVNPNTRDANVLGAVLRNVPADRWPGEGSAILNMVQASNIAQAIIGSRTYATVSQIAKVGDAGIEAAVPGVLDSLQKEAIIRNTSGLLSPRQNLFTILLAVQAYDSSGTVAAEQHAVALAWRDPYPLNATSHPAFIRFFKWLTD